MDGEAELGNLCRICSNKSEGISIFSSKGKEISLEEKIKKFLYITVSEEDDLPKTVCSCCTNKLDSIHKFAQMAAQMQIKLSEMISIPVKTSDPEMDPMEMEDEYVEPLDVLEQQIKLEHPIKLEHSIKQEEDTVRGSLLHSILTKDKDKGEPAVTELEVTVDPMLFLADQDEDEEEEEVEKIFPESSHSSRSDTNSEEDGNVFGGVLEAKPYQCSVCPRGFNSDLSLKNHLWGHGSMRKILASSDLNLNRFQVDSKPRVFNSQCLCTVCGRVYPTRSTLRAHQITHSNLRPHKCSLCEKTFKRNQDLKFHINQHTGERPYRCPYCPKAFASSGNCFSHRKRMHPKQLARDKKAAARQFYL